MLWEEANQMSRALGVSSNDCSGGSCVDSQEPARVAIRREHVLVVGRYLHVFRPVIDSVLDTIFWGDGYKSVAHLFLFSYLTFHHLCGIRFMCLLMAFHTFMVAGRASKVKDSDAVLAFKTTMSDLSSVLKRYQPSLHHTWSALLLVVVAACLIEVSFGVSLWEVLDACIGPLTIVVILTCYGLVDPRYTINYHTHHSRTSSNDSKEGAAVPGATISSGTSAAAADGLMRRDAPGCDQWETAVMSPVTERDAQLGPAPGLFAPGPTPTAEWDEILAPLPSIPVYMHKALMLYTKAPNWVDWKVGGDFIGRNHNIAWTQVKANLNAVMIQGVSFDDAVKFIDDDPDGTKENEKLHVWQYDVILGEYRRLRVMNRATRVVHYVYKQLFFAVAPRDLPMYSTAMELSRDEIEYYGLCRAHANNTEVTDGEGRFFILSSAPALGVPSVQGHVRAVIHRHALIVREIPALQAVQVMTLMCGEPGGRIPHRIIDIARGEGKKIVDCIKKAILRSCKKNK